MISQLFKEIKEDCKNLRKWFKKVFAFIALKRIKRKAYKLHKKNNCQMFVVKMGGKVKVISKQQFKYLRQHGKIQKDFTALELKDIALYYTPKCYDKKRVSRTAK